MSMIEEVGLGTTRETGSKNEVFDAYNELLRKLKDTQKTPAVIKQEEKIVEEKKQVVEVAVRDTGDKDVLATHLANLKASLNNSLDEIDLKLTAEQKKFATLQQAIKIQSKELNDLYEIRPAADTLAALLMAHKEKSLTLEQDMLQKRAAWKKEQEDFEAACKERDSQTARERQRTEEQYLYNHELSKRALEQELTNKRVQQDEAFKERELAIAHREREFQFHCETEKRNLEQTITTRRLEMDEEFKLREAKFETMRRNFEDEIASKRRELEEETKLREAKYETMRRNFEESNVIKRAEMEEEFKTREAKLEVMRRNLEENNNRRIAEMEEGFKLRETKIAARETEFVQMKERNENFPQEIQRAINEAERILTDKLNIKFEYEAKLLEKDFETERGMHRNAVKALESQIKNMEALNYNFRPMAFNPEKADEKYS